MRPERKDTCELRGDGQVEMAALWNIKPCTNLYDVIFQILKSSSTVFCGPQI